MNVYVWKTPNGYKVPILLEELGAEYQLTPVNLEKKEQLKPEFLALNPNHKIPVLVDGEVVIFESGAILLYLAEKFDRFFPKKTKEKFIALEWVMFQNGNIGPMFGQANHFKKHAPEKIEYAIQRYLNETKRLMGVLETRLKEVPYLAGEYGIADIMTWPWIRSAQKNGNATLSDFPSVERWFNSIDERAAVKRALHKVDEICK